MINECALCGWDDGTAKHVCEECESILLEYNGEIILTYEYKIAAINSFRADRIAWENGDRDDR
jgi:hypothetical protein